MKVLVTGGGGFLGGAIVRSLVARGDDVRSFARGDYPHLAASGVDVVRGDIADAAAVSSAVSGCDAVIHTAAKAGIWGTRRHYERSNVGGTENVIAACQTHGVNVLVHTSSPSVIFDGSDHEGIDESVPYPARFLAHYPRTKAVAERLVLSAASDELATVALRPHLIWGPGDPHLAPRLIERARRGRLRLVGNGENIVDAVYVDNAAAAHLAALDRLAAGAPISGRAYFVTQGEPLPISALINRILGAAGVAPVKRTIAPRTAYAAGAILEGLYRVLPLPGEPPMTRFLARQLATTHWFDLTAARRDLGYDPAVNTDEGMARLAEWFATGATSETGETGETGAGKDSS